MMDTTKFRIGKTHVSRTCPKEAIDRITKAALDGDGGYICVTNMRMMEYARKTPEYNQLMENSMMNWPDGKPLSWCAKMWGLSDVHCTRGPNIFQEMLVNGDKDLKHFLFGDTQEVLDEILRRYKDTCNIVGVYSPPFAPLEEYDMDAIEQMIRESGANIVWSAMTAPKQDYFDRLMAARIPQIVFVGVGRAFRISINKVKDAPEWAQKVGMGGVFIGRSKWYVRIGHYITRFFRLLGYFMEILWWRITGKKYYE